jgi:dipeptidyl aminopeptidase/acylaminoacyl peptidase
MQPLDKADYERALELWPQRLASLVRNGNPFPTWVGQNGDEHYWYRRELEDGFQFVLVNASTTTSGPAFDHERIAQGLARTLGTEVRAQSLPFSSFRFAEDRRSIVYRIATATYESDVESGLCREIDQVDDSVVWSPDGKRALYARDHNLWIRGINGDRALTTDGARYFAYGGAPDHDMSYIARARGLHRSNVAGCFWGPDSRTLLVRRIDERAIEPYSYFEPVPLDGNVRPKIHAMRAQFPGDTARLKREYFFIDVDTGSTVPVVLPQSLSELQINAGETGSVFWSPDAKHVFVLANTPACDRVALIRLEPSTGFSNTVIEEEANTFFDFNTLEYNTPNVRVLFDRREIVWYSQRDGWGHLYLYDLEGVPKHRITAGEWAVYDILRTDESEGHIYFTAAGREAGRHPYHRYLYRAAIEGEVQNADVSLLTPEDGDHGLAGVPTPAATALLGLQAKDAFSPSGRYFVDVYSTVETPPVAVIRRCDGSLVGEVERADASALYATGWRAPECFTVKAADGETDLWGVLITPRSFDARVKYPVVERIYGGPQLTCQPKNFMEGLAGMFSSGLFSLAEFGFVVAILDGPGTPGRSKRFHDMTYGTADRWGVRHHAAALRGAAESRPWMDLSRVGIAGHSYGGYGAIMALLLCGDLYKVGVSSAGMYDPASFFRSVPERHLGLPDYVDGRRTRNRPDEVSQYHKAIAASSNVHALTGKLLLAYGDLDEHSNPSSLLKFIDALVNAGKSYDLLYLPGRNHFFPSEPYFLKRMWDYFAEHLQQRAPLDHYRPNVA